MGKQVDAPSNSQVKKAGSTLRKAMHGDVDALFGFEDAYDVLLAWRAAHAGLLQKATMGLRSRVTAAGCAVKVSQRLKRVPTILDKLKREPSMSLAGMADIGGCRAVLASIEEVRRVQGRWELKGRTRWVKDYVETPRASGYRAVHVVVSYDGRLIEVQLRTRVMHEWAFMVEQMTGRFGLDIKNGRAPGPVQDWFKAVSDAMAFEEHGGVVPVALADQVATLREQAVPILKGGPR